MSRGDSRQGFSYLKKPCAKIIKQVLPLSGKLAVEAAGEVFDEFRSNPAWRRAKADNISKLQLIVTIRDRNRGASIAASLPAELLNPDCIKVGSRDQMEQRRPPIDAGNLGRIVQIIVYTVDRKVVGKILRFPDIPDKSLWPELPEGGGMSHTEQRMVLA